MLRQYKILSDTTTTDLEEQISAKAGTFTNMRVEGFAFDGTNYVVLISYDA